ncbi:MAG: non-canonical purine NTP pyrophosphatase, RdgB/HAM1 family [Alphaproteobacteria bacterium RIFCSPHIGHO2_12_FULL_45_9]|nr:MAG: non-canonical purine NTP pyrophosphatase, RdgB/HAM1 family [Alphaproteobacteria bacterium RIFCSPHIGHO2_12_FULL_45_9]
MLKKLLLATHNKGKIAEMSAMLAPYGVEVTSVAELGLPEPAETENTFVGNALIKARAAAIASGLPVLADDSGLCVNALNGDPGVYSADWAGNPRDFNVAMQKVHDALGDAVDRSAYFISVFALVMPDGTEQIFEGRCNGQIVWPPRGTEGHGYDPVFVADGETRTFGEMTLDEKAKFSHRAKAFEKFAETLK